MLPAIQRVTAPAALRLPAHKTLSRSLAAHTDPSFKGLFGCVPSFLIPRNSINWFQNWPMGIFVQDKNTGVSGVAGFNIEYFLVSTELVVRCGVHTI